MARTSSPVSDSVYNVPEPEGLEDTDKRNENEFASLGTHPKYPEIVAYLRDRQEYYRKYMPDGTALVGLSNEEAGAWWKCAATIIAEYEAFMNIVETTTDAVRASR